MFFLTTTAPSTLDNVLTISLVAALVIVVLIAVVRKAMANKKTAAQALLEEVAAPAVVEAPKAPGSAGQLKLHDVEPKTAAMLMAIVADTLGKPLNELRFISIKEVK